MPLSYRALTPALLASVCSVCLHNGLACMLCHVHQVMDAAEAKRVAVQEAWRQKQQAKYLRAGGVGMEQKMEQDAK